MTWIWTHLSKIIDDYYAENEQRYNIDGEDHKRKYIEKVKKELKLKWLKSQ